MEGIYSSQLESSGLRQAARFYLSMAPHAEEIYPKNSSTAPSLSRARSVIVNSPNVKYTENEILSKYIYYTTSIEEGSDGNYVAQPKECVYDFKVQRHIGKVGVMLVGWGGNNGSTVTAGILANRHGLKWDTREGVRSANYYGSMTMSSTVKLGTHAKTGKEIHVPFRDVLPMIHPNDLAIGGWDISSMNLADSMDRAQVLEPSLKAQLKKTMAHMKPLPGIYYPDFIAANQEGRADNVIPGSRACVDHIDHIRNDIR